MDNTLQATVKLTNGAVRFAGTVRDNPPVMIDYTPPIGGGEGYTSLELFLVSLATCSGTSIAVLLRKMQRTVAGLTVQASGKRREQHPTYFETITLAFHVESPDATDEEVGRALAISEETLCPVWGMIKQTVPVKATFDICRHGTAAGS